VKRSGVQIEFKVAAVVPSVIAASHLRFWKSNDGSFLLHVGTDPILVGSASKRPRRKLISALFTVDRDGRAPKLPSGDSVLKDRTLARHQGRHH
jgi:hypothetical protein